MAVPLHFAKGDDQVFQHDGLREKVLRPTLQRLQNGLIVRANDQDRQARTIVRDLANQVQ